MYKIKMWYGIVIIALVSIVFLGIGFYNAVRFSISAVDQAKVVAADASSSGAISSGKGDGKNMNVNPKLDLSNKKNVAVMIIGDSIARGAGDEKNKGIGGNLVDLLKNATPKDVVVENAGIDGLKIEGLEQQFKEKKLDSGITKSDFVIVSIGGNDLREIRSPENPIEQETLFKERQGAYESGIKYVVKRIRELNKEATIIFVGVYNPYENAVTLDINRYLTRWNNSTQTICDDDYRTVFISTYSLFKYNIQRFIAPDNLHPNAMGYYTIAHQIYKTIENYFTR